jgi:mRNA interferase MazF
MLRMLSGGPMHSVSTGPSFYGKPFVVILTASLRRAMPIDGRPSHWMKASEHSPTSQIGGRQRTGQTGPMQRGEVWFAATPGGDRPVLVLTRDPVAGRIGSVVVAALTRTRRGLASELELTTADGVPTESVVNFDNIHTIPRRSFRRRVTSLPAARMAEACRIIQAATGC